MTELEVKRHPLSERFHAHLWTIAEISPDVFFPSIWTVSLDSINDEVTGLKTHAKDDVGDPQIVLASMRDLASHALVGYTVFENTVRETEGLPTYDERSRYRELLADAGAMHDKKQQDYGRENDPFSNVRATEEWGMPAWVGAMMRLNDKVRRLEKAAMGSTLANEGVLDSLIDIAVYAIIAHVLYEQDKGLIK